MDNNASEQSHSIDSNKKSFPKKNVNNVQTKNIAPKQNSKNHGANANANFAQKQNSNKSVSQKQEAVKNIAQNKNVNQNKKTNKNAHPQNQKQNKGNTQNKMQNKNAVASKNNKKSENAKKVETPEIVEEEIELSYDEILRDLKVKQTNTLKKKNEKAKAKAEEKIKNEEKKKAEQEKINATAQKKTTTTKKNIEKKIIAQKQKSDAKSRPVNNRPFRNLKNTTDAIISKEVINKAQFEKDNLKIMFLGGTGEIGKNMTVLEYGDDIIVIDSGLSFPTDDMPGVDLVIPDITYLVQNKARVKAIFITHGHEDHIGSLPFVLRDLKCPVYATKLTLALIDNKLREHPKVKCKGTAIEPKQVINVGYFSVEALKVNHSISGSLAFAITTPVGLVFHTGDFKIDNEALDGAPTDIKRMKELGDKGVLLLLCESTNVERTGHSISERTVSKNLDVVFGRNDSKRIFIATFASNIDRIQQIINIAGKYKRKVAFTGRSMVNNMEAASKVGAITFDKENLIDIDQIANYPDAELCIITTGSQGEPLSALSRIASGDFNKVKVGENDCIILSSSPIPGNEKSVGNIINALYRKGADVVYNDMIDIHASGHAYREELEVVHRALRPKYFIPVHGEYKHFVHHKKLSLSLGTPKENIILPDNGLCVEINDKGVFREAGYVPAGTRLVDGSVICDYDNAILKDRKALSEDGVCVAIAVVDRKKNRIVNGPEFITRGLIYANEAYATVDEAKDLIKSTILQSELANTDLGTLKNNVRKALNNYFTKKYKRNPTILVVIYDAQ